MRPIRKKAPPRGVFPKRFLVSTLRRLGQEVGFTLPTLAGPDDGARALPLRIRVYRAGREAHSIDIAADARQSCIEAWQRQWETGIDAGRNDEDLIAVEYLHRPEDEAWLAPIMAEDIEGQILARTAEGGRYSTVLTSMVPFRPAGYKFTPIIGLTHYHKFGPEFENYTLFVNLKGAGDGDGANRLHIDYYSFSGARLATADLDVPYSSGYLHAVEASLTERGVPADAFAGGVIAHCRGGASQFSIFTLIRNKRTGALGFEHSLPPYYYVTGISHPAIRGPFYARALA